MKSKLLFPSYFRVIGMIMLIPGLVCGYLTFIFSASESFFDESSITLLSVGLLFVGFSQFQEEDETTQKIRLNAIYWAVLVDALCVAILWLLIVVNGVLHIAILEKIYLFPADFYNWFFILAIFIGRLYYLLNKHRASARVNPILLIPYKPYNLIGKIIAPLLFVLLAVDIIFNLKNNIHDNLICFIPVSLLVLIGSKERNETEEITNIRLNAMQEAVYINYILFLLATWTLYGLEYLMVLMVSLISIPCIFVFIFYVTYFKTLGKYRKAALSSS